MEGGQGAPSSAAAVDPAASPAWRNPAPASWQGILPGSRRRGRSWGREVGRSTERSSVPGPPHLYFFVRRSYRGTFDEADHLARPCLTFVQARFGFFAGAAAAAGDVRRGFKSSQHHFPARRRVGLGPVAAAACGNGAPAHSKITDCVTRGVTHLGLCNALHTLYTRVARQNECVTRSA